MATDDASAIGTDELLNQLKENVELRRKAGDYPPELEERLAQHFIRIHNLRSAHTPVDLSDALTKWNNSAGFRPEQVEYSSRVPLGSSVHKAAGHLSSRQTTVAVRQVYDAVTEILTTIIGEMNANDAYVRSEVVNQIDILYERLSDLARLANNFDVRFQDLEQRVSELEKNQPPASGR